MSDGAAESERAHPGDPSRGLIAANDRIVSSRAIETFASRLKIGAHVPISQSQHEILQESDTVRQHFWSVFDAYLGIGANAA